jgi:hypothetical protein
MEDKRIEVRFIRSEENAADIETKNTDGKTFEKHTASIRNGILKCWMEDVKAAQSDRRIESVKQEKQD